MDILLSPQLLFSALVLGSLYALIAMGLNFVYGTLRLLNIAHGDLVMIGAYAAFSMFTLLGVYPVLGMPLIAVATTVIGVGLYLGLFKSQLESSSSVEQLEANSLLLFFGVSVILQNTVALMFTTSPRAYQHLDAVISLYGVDMSLNRLVALMVALVIVIAVAIFLRMSVYGLSISALIQHREAAKIVGINIERVQLGSVVIGFGIAGIAGTLISMTEQLSPFMGFPFTIAAFVVIILGGLGNIAGGIIAGVLLGFIEIYSVALTSATYRSILIYGIFVIAIMLRPQGVFGKTQRG